MIECALCHIVTESIREHGIMCPSCTENILCNACYDRYDPEGDGRFKGSDFAFQIRKMHEKLCHNSVDLV